MKWPTCEHIPVSGSFFPVFKGWDNVGSVQSYPRWDGILETGVHWMLAQDPEISPGQDDRSKFNTPNRKFAWIPWILHRKVFVWKFWTEKGLGTLCLWRPSDGREDLSWPIAEPALETDDLLGGSKGASSHWYRHFTQRIPVCFFLFLIISHLFVDLCVYVCMYEGHVCPCVKVRGQVSGVCFPTSTLRILGTKLSSSGVAVPLLPSHLALPPFFFFLKIMLHLAQADLKLTM